MLFAFPQAVSRITVADGLAGLLSHPAMRLRPTSSQSVNELPFSGGWMCAFAYELGGLFEPSVAMVIDPDFPLAWLARIPAAILYDRTNARCALVAEAGHAHLLDSLQEDLERALPPLKDLPELKNLQEDAPEAFLAGLHGSRNTSVPATFSRSISRVAGRASLPRRFPRRPCLSN
jgi:anthranilate synthase component I